MNEKTCVTCHYGKRDDFGDLICVNAKSNNCSDWVCENDTCDCWQKRIVTNFERITASPEALATAAVEYLYQGQSLCQQSKNDLIKRFVERLNSEADEQEDL